MVVDMNWDKARSQHETTTTTKGGERRTDSHAEVIVVHDSDSEEEFSSGSLNQTVLHNEDQTHHTITDSPVISASDCETEEEVLEASGEEIPRPLTPPRLRNVPMTLPVLFDLETTGLEPDSHILQIAASSPGNSFCRYVRPKKAIDFMAQSVHGLSFDGRTLFLWDHPVDAVNIYQALSDFLVFLGGGPVTLFGHNAKRFDCPILINAVKACNLLAEYERTISGFVDTLPLFRDVCPGLPSYKQIALYDHFFHESYTAHEAVSDVEALKKLLRMPCVTAEAISRQSFCFDYILQVDRRSIQEQKMLPSWNIMIRSGSVKQHMAKRAAGSGLGVHHLRLAYREDGETGVQNVLKHPNSEGKPRVTKNKRVLTQISSYIAQNPIEDNFKILYEGGSGQTDYIDGDKGYHEYDNDSDLVGDDYGDEGNHEYDNDSDLVGEDDGNEGHHEHNDDRNLVDDDGDDGHLECDDDRNVVDDDDSDGHHENDNGRNFVEDDDSDEGHHESDDDRNVGDDDSDEGHHESDDDRKVGDDDSDEDHHEYDHNRNLVGNDHGDEGHLENDDDRNVVDDDDLNDEGHHESDDDRNVVEEEDSDEGHHESDNGRTVGEEDDSDEGHHEYDNDRSLVGNDNGEEGHHESDDDRNVVDDNDSDEGHHESDDGRNVVDDDDDDDDSDEGHHETDDGRNVGDDNDSDEGHHESDDGRNVVGDDDDDDDDSDEGHHEYNNPDFVDDEEHHDHDLVSDDDGDEGHHEHDRDLLGDDGDRRRVGGSDGHHYRRPRPRDERKDNNDNVSDNDENPTRKKYPKISHQEEKETLGENTSSCSIA